MANVILKNVNKTFGKDEYAVKDFCLEVADKEFVVLVGPSGCGKSTTLRMIAGLEEISSGEIYILDKLVNNIEPKDRDIAMVFQNYALYPHMTVYENMAFSLKLRKIDKKEIDRKVKETAEILSIQGFLKRKPKTLSGGQRQRVAIGRAIVRNPKVFLMDEPLSNLDAKLRNQMRTELMQLRKRINTTFIYVTHDQIEAMTLGDRIVVMNNGVIQQTDTPQNVYDNPANLFVAGFIGTPQMNFFKGGKLITERGEYYVDIFEKKYALPQNKQNILKEKNVPACDIIVGVRPEDTEIIASEISAEAVVELSELIGNEIILHVSIESQPAVMRVKASYRGHESEKVPIMFDKEKIHIFDPVTERNLIV
jgi:multiple sugar transport system ATP-binding protein